MAIKYKTVEEFEALDRFERTRDYVERQRAEVIEKIWSDTDVLINNANERDPWMQSHNETYRTILEQYNQLLIFMKTHEDAK